MKNRAWLLFALSGAAFSCAHPAFAAATTDKKVHIFGSLDYFLVGNAADRLKDENDDINSETNGFLSGSVTSNPGFGLRVGPRFTVASNPMLDWGVTLGYLHGPEVTDTRWRTP